MTKVLEIKELRVALKKKGSEAELIKGVSFSVSAGECLGILGESGSGKSMSVKAALGLLDKSFHKSGSALFMGEELFTRSAEELRALRGSAIAVILQNPMTCFDPLYRIGRQMAETYLAHERLSNSEIRERSINILERMRIKQPEEVLEKYPHQLSGGMLQRIMIGLALSMKPKLLIADEPTTAIDSITQYEILKELSEIKRREDTAMIFISHDLNAISMIADRIVVMNQGLVVDKGDFEHILHHAEDEYTRLLVEKRAAVSSRYRAALRGESYA